MPTPDAGNLSLGAGEVLFDRFDANGNPTGYRHLGNVESLAITTTVETVQKKSSMDGARGIYKEAVIGSEAEVSCSASTTRKTWPWRCWATRRRSLKLRPAHPRAARSTGARRSSSTAGTTWASSR